MVIKELPEFLKLLQNNQRLLGLDIGTKVIGIALSDERRVIASPHSGLERKKLTKDAEAIFDIVKKQNVGGIVAGLPLNMDGSEGPMAQSIRQFMRNLLKINDIPVYFQDERMSTMATERMLLEADLSRNRRSELVDKAAASYILQCVLDTRG